MNDYEETFKLSKQEINSSVAKIIYPDSYEIKDGGVSVRMKGTDLLGNAISYRCDVDFCTNWNDAGPVILENKIDLRFDLDEKGTCTAVSPDGLGYYDKSPLRAAMIVFLMMKEQENETTN